MPSISADNLDLTARVQAVRDRYQAFNMALRGATAELLTGLSNGTASMLRLATEFDGLAHDLVSDLSHQATNDLSVLSLSAYKTSAGVSDALNSERAATVSQTLLNGFRDSIESVVAGQALRDARNAEQFVRRQLFQGRAVATTAELSVDLEFKHTTKGGRQIDSVDYINREVNWSYRQHYNTLMTYILMSSEVDEAVVDGGSKAGDTVDLASYETIAPVYFHHNSQALLQPKGGVMKDERPDI